MDTKYKLYISSTKTKETKDATLISSDDNKSGYSIERLSYRKGLYSPNSVDVEVKVTDTSDQDINKTFTAKKYARLLVSVKESHEICYDYFIYQFRIVSVSSVKTVHLTLFSRDKLLTLDKFSKVYLNQRLGLDIIQASLESITNTRPPSLDILQSPPILKACNIQVLKDKSGLLDISRLQFLHYKITGTTSKDVEAIQPYRVQYNEDFYSFISRVACQCGEMLFFEDGVLTLGPDPKKTKETAIQAEDIYRIEFPTVESSPLSVNDYHRNFLVDDTAPAANSLQYSDCESFDEYYDEFKSDDLPDSLKSEFYWPDLANMVIKTIAPAPGIAASSGDAVTAIEKGFKAAKEFTSFMGRYGANRDYVNRQYKANVFDSPASKSNNFQADQQKNGTALCQFADVFEDGKLKHGRLADIRKKEMAAAKQTVTVQIKTSSFAGLKLKLGCRVKLQSDNDTIYVVTACRGDFALKVKVGSKVISEERDITELEIVPLQGDKFVPPYNKCAEFTPVQPQTATVSDASDPRMLGRVRIRYPWQTVDSGSPWVRVLTPFSSESGCIHFQPHNGDEVMIGYVGGNVERPYVIGSLFGKDKGKIHDNLYLTNNNTISVGSQRLDFREGTMSPFLSSFWPGWSFISQFAPGAASKMKTSHSSGWHGTTKLTDVNGFWKIEGNTANRSVTIDSAWGKVTISAYTGINIEAVGDVTIKGKNININAQNNVTIESGIAIKNARKSKATPSPFKTVLADIATDFVNLDLSFIRTIWESIVPPKEGTLKIKSNRYLMLEAGKGVASDNENSPDPLNFDKAIDADKITNRPFVSGQSRKTVNIIETAICDVRKILSAVQKYYPEKIVGENQEEEKSKEISESQQVIKNISNIDDSDEIIVKDLKNIKPDGLKELPEYAQKIEEKNPNANEFEEKSLLEASHYILSNAGNIIGINKNMNNSNDGEIENKVKDAFEECKDELGYGGKDVFVIACSNYLLEKGFRLGKEGDSWEKRVNGLTLPPKYPKLKFLFGKTGESVIPGSDYVDRNAGPEMGGKIIASFEEAKSLELQNDGKWMTTYNITMKTLKDLLMKCYDNIAGASEGISENNKNMLE